MEDLDYEEALSVIEQEASFIERALGLKEGFISRLADEDDWSFIIKAHALVEAALTNWISVHLNEKGLIEPLSYLEIGHSKYGKVALTKALDITTPYDRKFLRELTKLRNKLAHKVEHVSFTFDNHLIALSKSERKEFVSAFSYFYLREGTDGQTISPPAELITKNLKLAVLNAIKMFLATVGLQMQTQEFKRQTTKSQLKILELLEEREKLREVKKRHAADS